MSLEPDEEEGMTAGMWRSPKSVKGASEEEKMEVMDGVNNLYI